MTQTQETSSLLLKEKMFDMLIEAKAIMEEQNDLIKKQRKILYDFVSCMKEGKVLQKEGKEYLEFQMSKSMIVKATETLHEETTFVKE